MMIASAKLLYTVVAAIVTLVAYFLYSRKTDDSDEVASSPWSEPTTRAIYPSAPAIYPATQPRTAHVRDYTSNMATRSYAVRGDAEISLAQKTTAQNDVGSTPIMNATVQRTPLSFAPSGSGNGLPRLDVRHGPISLDTGPGGLRCPKCDKMFGSGSAVIKHFDVMHGRYPLQIKELEPVDSGGQWVPTSDFTGTKSFGAFQCHCKRFWVSAHARRKPGPGYAAGFYEQRCKTCNELAGPLFMWVNAKNERKRGPDERPPYSESRPHLREKCEACLQGDLCTPYVHK